MDSYENKVIRLTENNNYHPATKVVLLLIRLKIRFLPTLFIPYFSNKTTLVATNYIFSSRNLISLFQINKKLCSNNKTNLY